MGYEIATLVLNSISTLSAVVQAYKAAYDLNKEFTADDVQNIIDGISVLKLVC